MRRLHAIVALIAISVSGAVPALAANYARSRNLELLAVPPDHAAHRGAAFEKQAESLVSPADAVVVVWSGTCEFDRILGQAAKGIPVRPLGAEPRGKSAAPPESPPQTGNLPD